MNRILLAVLLIATVCSSCAHTYYIVRHAEKATQEANMTSDVPLTDKGKARAEELKKILKDAKIAYIYSTNTIRTKSTAQPTADFFHLPIEIYGPRPDSAFIQLLKSKKKNVLIVGHSNTVDDIVNMLCGETKVASDLPDSEYNLMFIVRVKGKRKMFSSREIYSPQSVRQ